MHSSSNNYENNMADRITLDDLQGSYDIAYQTTPQMPDWYEPGFGACKVHGSHLHGIDGAGVSWNADFLINDNDEITFHAVLDPSVAPPQMGLLDNTGMMTRSPQVYDGIMHATRNGNGIILRTTIHQGPMTIEVQLVKRTA